MKVVNQEFLDLQAKNHIKYYREINLYRRSWDIGTEQYIYEETPIDIRRYVDRISPLAWSLDTEALHVWRTSNISLTVKNINDEFNPDTSGSLLDGYELYKCKVEIKVGYYNASNVPVTTYVYTGIIEKDPTYNYDTRRAILNVSGMETLLANANAMNVSLTVTDEVLGVGDGTASQVFETDENAVARILDSKVDGVAQFEGVDYQVGNVHGSKNPSQITYTPAPPLGLEVTASYDYWYTNKTIAEVVTLLLQEAGFAEEEMSVDAGIFYSGEKSKAWNTKTDLEDSVRSYNVDTASQPGDALQVTENFDDLVLDGLTLNGGVLTIPIWTGEYECDDLPESATPAWARTIDPLGDGSGAFGTREILSGICHFLKPAGSGTTLVKQAERFQINDATSTVAFKLKMASSDYTSYSPHGSFRVEIANGSFKAQAIINTQTSGTGARIYTTGGGAENVNVQADYVVFWMYITGAGKVKTYVDGVEITGSGGDATASADNYIRFDFIGLDEYINLPPWTYQFGTAEFWLDYLRRSNQAFAPTSGPTGSATMETGLNFWEAGSWGTIWKQEVLNSGTILYETQSCATSDFADPDAWTAVTWVGNVGTIHSAQLKYLRWRLTITPSGATSPEVSEVTMPASILFVSVDCSTDLQDYRTYDSWYNANGGTLRLLSLTSTDDSTFDAEEVITAGAITSDVHRYIKFRNEISKTSDDDSLVIHRNKFVYKIKSFTCSMANFNNMNVQSAVEQIARVLDYEVGVDAQGIYFFRSRDVTGAVDWTFEEDVDLIERPVVRPGWEKVRNDITAEYGKFSATSDQFLALDSRPNSVDKWGRRIERMGEACLAVDDDVNISIAMSETYFTNRKAPKKIVNIKTKAIPQLDLGDKVQVNSGVLVGINLKVVSINLDTDTWTMEVTAWEI